MLYERWHDMYSLINHYTLYVPKTTLFPKKKKVKVKDETLKQNKMKMME